MQAALNQFKTNIQHVRNLGTIYRALKAQTTGILDLSDILRAELVLAVSALDYFVHEIVRLGVLESYHGQRPQTEAFLRFQITLQSAIQGISSPMSNAWLDDQIRTRHSYQSFQHPERIADAIRLISDAGLWDAVASQLGSNVEGVKQKLTLIVNRRNQIAHEADCDPSYPGRRWPIDNSLVDDSIDFIERLCEALFTVVT